MKHVLMTNLPSRLTCSELNYCLQEVAGLMEQQPQFQPTEKPTRKRAVPYGEDFL